MEYLFDKIQKLSEVKIIIVFIITAIIMDTLFMVYFSLIFSIAEYFEIISTDLMVFLTGSVRESSLFEDLFLASLVAPLVETLYGQALLYWLISKITSDKTYLIVLMTVIFAALHVQNGYMAMFATLSGSFIISLTYVYFKRISFKKAYWYTALVHSLANTYVVIFYHLS